MCCLGEVAVRVQRRRSLWLEGMMACSPPSLSLTMGLDLSALPALSLLLLQAARGRRKISKVYTAPSRPGVNISLCLSKKLYKQYGNVI